MAAKKLECVKVEKKGGISWVWLNRPEKRNAMSPQLHFEMDETLRELETDPETRCVVIAGAGGYFSATRRGARPRRKPPTAGAGNGSTSTTSRPSP